MRVLKAEDMHCNKCVERITKALNDAGMKFKVSLDNKTVAVDGDDACVAKAVELLDDLGFEAVEI